MSSLFIVLFLAFVVHLDVNAQPEIAPRPRCGRHAVWSNCASLCPVSCEGLKNPDPIMCPAVCVNGCVCLRGYIRISDTNPNCMLERDCPNLPRAKCGENAVWRNCTTICIRTCQNMNDPPRPCPLVCRRGCACLPGFVRKSITDPNCVKPQDCSK